MSAFEIVRQDRVIGKLTCFDRLILEGHLARFDMPGRLKSFLDQQGVLLKDFDRYVTKTTDALKAHARRWRPLPADHISTWPRPTPRAGVSPRRSWLGASPPVTGSWPG